MLHNGAVFKFVSQTFKVHSHKIAHPKQNNDDNYIFCLYIYYLICFVSFGIFVTAVPVILIKVIIPFQSNFSVDNLRFIFCALILICPICKSSKEFSDRSLYMVGRILSHKGRSCFSISLVLSCCSLVFTSHCSATISVCGAMLPRLVRQIKNTRVEELTFNSFTFIAEEMPAPFGVQ